MIAMALALEPKLLIADEPTTALDVTTQAQILKLIGAAICEGMVANGIRSSDARARIIELLELVGLQAAAINRFPHEFSGGQRQRVGIARALALNPEVLIADEAVSALDVSVQYRVLQILRDVQARMGLAILFVTHDLRVAAQMCDRIAVMQWGHLVEEKDARELLAAPEHEYTRSLLAAIPGHMQVHADYAPAER